MARGDRAKVLRAIADLGRKGGHFTTREVRERCGWGEKDERARIVYKAIDQLKKDGTLFEASTGRKRHKFWGIKEEQLQRRIDSFRPGNGVGAVTAPQAVGNGVAGGLMGRLELIDSRISDLEKEMQELREQLEPVVRFITG